MPAFATDSCRFHSESALKRCGTAFGSSDGAVFGDAFMPTAPGVDDRGSHPSRQRDRRRAVADLVASLSRSIDRRYDISTLRAVFEETLRRVVPVRAVQLREGSLSRANAGGHAEAIALEVPGLDVDRSGLLEASFDPS